MLSPAHTYTLFSNRVQVVAESAVGALVAAVGCAEVAGTPGSGAQAALA